MSKHRHLPRRQAERVDEDGNVFVRRMERRVLIPGTNVAAPHPWRDRLRAAMDGKPKTKADEKAEVAS